MKARAWFAVTLLLAVAAPAGAETVVEASRSAFGKARSVSANRTDGSCWAATGSSVMHVNAQGELLSQTNGFQQSVSVWPGGRYDTPLYVSVNPADGSCWVADTMADRVVRLSSDGAVDMVRTGFSMPRSVSPNPTDGSCWVADTGHQQAVHLSADGDELWRGGAFDNPWSVCVNPTDGSCWVADSMIEGHIVHLAADGSVLWQGGGFDTPVSVSVNPIDGSCWTMDGGPRYGSPGDGQVVHLSATGEELYHGGAYYLPSAVSVNPSDGSCWVTDWSSSGLFHIAADGSPIWSVSRVRYAGSVSVNPTDGSCWAAAVSSRPDPYGFATYAKAFEHRAANGDLLWEAGGLHTLGPIAVDATDGSCWLTESEMAGTDFANLVRFSPQGEELLRAPGWYAASLSFNPGDQSLWLACGAVVHTDVTGGVLWQGGGLRAVDVSVYPQDGSCWAASSEDSAVVHLSSGGAELRRDTFAHAGCVAVNPDDGSCWIGTSGEVILVTSTGAEVCQATVNGPVVSLSAVPSDGSCWVAGTDVAHVSVSGEVLWSSSVAGTPQFDTPTSVSVDPRNGSCWVADGVHHQVVHLAPNGAELSRRGGFAFPLTVRVDPGDGSVWVTDEGRQLTHLVLAPPVTPTADFEAAPVSGAAPLEVTFTDLSTNDPMSWTWSFGDGAASDRKSPVHTYSEVGTYTVSLTVANDAGTDTETKSSYVTVSPPLPTADFSGSPTQGAAPLTVVFTNASTGATSWLWDFGGEGTSAEQNPTFEFTTAGRYTVALTATNAWGSVTATKEDYIFVTFPDVPMDFWALGEIVACVDAGIVQGYADGYHPERTVDRASMAVYIARALAGGEANVPANPSAVSFPDDVPNTHWAYKYVEYAVDAGVVQGYDATHYRPDTIVTRDQMTVFVARAKHWVHLGDDMTAAPELFSDVPAGFWCGAAVQACVEHHVVQGYADGTYHPERQVTRDQMAVYVARAFELPY